MQKYHVVCVGGGHGLGQLLSVFTSLEYESLTGIVATTDNGGSTGKIRKADNNIIAWGDIRFCLEKLSPTNEIQSLLFEHRFDKLGAFSGHSLGNLMLCALDEMCIRPTESVKVMTKFLNVTPCILPMSDHSAHLKGVSMLNHEMDGEVEVDKFLNQGIKHLYLEPQIKPSPEVLLSLSQANIMCLGPGSFFTSVLPCLLMKEVIEVINQNEHMTIYFFINVNSEFSNDLSETSLFQNFFNKLGLKKAITYVIPAHRECEKSTYNDVNYIIASLPQDKHGRHNKRYLETFITSNILK